jgi:hypothetical protein
VHEAGLERYAGDLTVVLESDALASPCRYAPDDGARVLLPAITASVYLPLPQTGNNISRYRGSGQY